MPGAQQQLIAKPLAFATGVVCLATLLAYGGRWSWFCELLVNFRTHFAILLSLALVFALVIRHWLTACVALAGLALNVWPLYGAFFGTSAPPPPDGRPLRLAAFNVQVTNDDMPGIAKYLESQAVDIVVLEELSPAYAEQLAALLPRLPHHYLAQNDGVAGVAILSRWPLLEAQPARRGRLTFAARVDVDLGDRKLRLYGAHLRWPVVPGMARIRNAQLKALGRELAKCPHACVAVGDFNTTPWSSHFRDMLSDSGVRDCAAGRGVLGTWSSSLPAMLRIRIDQCLAAGAVGVADVRVGESAGSDHLSTLNDLSIGRP